MNPVSVVIRSCNEKDSLQELMTSIKAQDYKGEVEIIVVDNESTDGTAELAQELGARLVNIPRDEFTYPKSMNLGVENASHEIVILTVAHALPTSKRWISSAEKYFADEKVAGVFAHCLPAKKRTLAEILFYYPNYLLDLIHSPRIITKTGMGVMGATNCVIRRSLWEKERFDENYELGGEDGKWTSSFLSKGYKIVMDVNFTVYHSHHLGFKSLFKQLKYWSLLGQEQKFDREKLAFRGKIFQNQ